jgi:hypothetical protein
VAVEKSIKNWERDIIRSENIINKVVQKNKQWIKGKEHICPLNCHWSSAGSPDENTFELDPHNVQIWIRISFVFEPILL